MSQAKKKSTANGSGLGVDTLLTSQGKALKSGEEIRFVLVKGPSSSRTLTNDPVNPKAPKQAFPLVAKFSESVVRPGFDKAPWNTARLYQRDVPKAEDDSDDEANNGGNGSPSQGQPLQPKKRWRARNQKETKRQWVLQEEVEFLESMMAKRQEASKKGLDGNTNDDDTSSIYEGMPERNSSQFVLLEANTSVDQNIQVTVLPTPHATISFSRPKAIKTLSMSEAEQAIDDQRNKTTRFMMHDQQRIFQGQAPIHQSRTRLLGKLLSAGEDDNDNDNDNEIGGTGKKKSSGSKRKRLMMHLDGGEEDDVMGDLTFRNRSTKGSAKARQELLNSFGNDMRVDADGVLGGANDAIFGQRGQKFGHFSAGKEEGKKGGTAAGGKAAGNDGNAMADDFYQRDVQAEYEELDYDANEQFDDDDVDVGETDVHIGDSNFGGIDDDDDDDDLENDVHGERPTGAEGLASLAGFRLMLAKARGEITPEQLAELADKNKRQAEEEDKMLAENDRKKEDGDSSSGNHLAAIMEAAEKARLEGEKKLAAQRASAVGGNADDGQGGDNGANGGNRQPRNNHMMEVDENGQRLVTLEAVRHEIWLTRGRIPMKRLMKIFAVNKKASQDKKQNFKRVIQELCTIEQDPIGGRMLVLKQHYRRGN